MEWTERLLEEQPTHQALPNCLAALVQLVAGHREADRVSALAVKAGSSEPERALEVLNALFKDRKQRGGYVASSEVVDLALGVLRSSIQGTAERGAYQRACRLLDWLVLEPQNREMLASRGGLALLLQVMEKFQDDLGVLLEGCACLRSVASESSLDHGRATAVLISCLQKFIENGQLQWRALAALQAFPVPPKASAILIAKLACAAASQHPRFDSVVEWIAKLHHRLASVSDSGVSAWLREPTRGPWVKKFEDMPRHIRQPNNEAEVWASRLCSLCRK